MNSLERVRAIINNKKADYVPNGLGGCETEGLHVLVYYELQKLYHASLFRRKYARCGMKNRVYILRRA